MFETFNHTADLGIRVQAETLQGLFEEAATALFSVMVVDPKTIRPNQEFSFRIAGTRTDELFLDWLAELLYMFSAKHVLLVKFDVNLDDGGLTAKAWGEPYSPSVHQVGEEVKAITYHGLKVENVGDHWLGEVIVDL